MTDEEALLAAICASPDEDTPRLAFADYLDEQGGEANVARAAFIRIQCELARLPANATEAIAARQTEMDLWAAHRREWKQRIPDIPGINWRGYDRGFLTTIDAEQMSLFVRHANELFAVAPVQNVRILHANPNTTGAIVGLQRLEWLRELDLTGCRVLTDDDALLLAQSPGVCNLRVLRLGGNRITEQGAQALARSPFLQNLIRLDLRSPRTPEASRRRT